MTEITNFKNSPHDLPRFHLDKQKEEVMKKITIEPDDREIAMVISVIIGMLIGFLFFMATKNNNSIIIISAIAVMLISLVIGFILIKLRDLFWLVFLEIYSGGMLFFLFIAFELAGKRTAP